MLAGEIAHKNNHYYYTQQLPFKTVLTQEINTYQQNTDNGRASVKVLTVFSRIEREDDINNN